MKAVEVRRTGPPEALEAAELPIPQPARGEVRIRVRRAGVNFADLLARPVIAGEIPLERAPEAHRMLQEGSTIGKVQLSVGDR